MACQALSIAMRQALCLYDLTERELRLANWLILETYDRGEFKGRIDFRDWAQKLGFWDSDSVRPGKCRDVFIDLKNLGLLDWNETEGTYELRPYHTYWTGLKQRGLLSESTRNQDLPLRAERLLPEALSEVSRENALASGPDPAQPVLQNRSRDWAALYQKLKQGLNDPDEMERLLNEFGIAENQEPPSTGEKRRLPAENAGELNRQKTPVTQTLEKSGVSGLPAKNAGCSIASLALSTKAKLAIRPAKNAGEAADPETARRFLESVDVKGTLHGRFGQEYEKLCEQSPGYVLNRLKPALEEHLSHYRRLRGPDYSLQDPVGWMGSKAAAAGLMKWHGRRH